MRRVRPQKQPNEAQTAGDGGAVRHANVRVAVDADRDALSSLMLPNTKAKPGQVIAAAH